MRYLDHLFPTTRPKEGGSTADLLEAAGYIKPISAGCIALMPLGRMVYEKVCVAFRDACVSSDFWEVSLPLLQNYSLWEESGRSEVFGRSLCTTTIGSGQKFVVNPTQEEAALDLIRKASGFDRLPIRIFQVGERIRNELRPAHGLIRTRTFFLGDIYSFSADNNAEHEEIGRLENLFSTFLAWTGLTYNVGEYTPSHLGPPAFSYWVKSPMAQCVAHLCQNCGRSYRFTQGVPDRCPCCDSAIEDFPAVELGDIMRSGTHLSAKMDVTPPNGQPVHVSLAGIGLGRLIQVLAEQYSDIRGLVWPRRMSPFDIHAVCAVGQETTMEQACAKLEHRGLSVICDTRRVGLGRKLVDCDLIGIPTRLVFGKTHNADQFEFSGRSESQTRVGSVEDVTDLVNAAQ